MTDNKREQLIKTIEDLFAKANDAAATEAEAMQAGKMAQKLMAKYHIEAFELGQVKDDIIENNLVIRKRHWIYQLGSIVAENFCCRYCFGLERNKNTGKKEQVATFFGRDVDTQVAIKVFNTLVSIAERRIRECKSEFYRKYGNYLGVEKMYADGFVSAVKEELKSNCRALCLVVPEEVKEQFKEKYPKLGTARCPSTVYYTKDKEAIQVVYQKGREDGRNAAQRRKLHA